MNVAAPPVPYELPLALRLLRDMLRIRRFEERAAELYGAGKIRGFLHLYIGEEAVAVGALHALTPDDAVVATYREHGHALVRGMAMNAIMAEMFGKQEGCSRGRGGSMPLFDAATRFYGGNAIAGGGLPLAVGLALADRMSPTGPRPYPKGTSFGAFPSGQGISCGGQTRQRVTACFFGDGAVAEGAFHESLNLAALWQLPVLFCCENNLYAMGTSLARSESQTDLSVKAAAFKIPTIQADGMDVVAVHDAARAGAAHVREGGGPLFIEFQTYRFRAHSMFDPELYRDKAEVEKWKERGPLHSYTTRLKAHGMLTEEEFLACDAEALAEVEASVTFAEAGTWEPVENLTRDVYSPPPAAAA
ncbi:MAG: pyruvate dehydrogenase (acetyl-transferring) E1 component subunit alpha [Rhodocyclaceae bacterium]|nr:MAG: pyruvate dehydrogenase (acetyl-transferring) E1 component subunit alpha [Rhodocyclaceae bacterium]